jgi:hypothetical protein
VEVDREVEAVREVEVGEGSLREVDGAADLVDYVMNHDSHENVMEHELEIRSRILRETSIILINLCLCL